MSELFHEYKLNKENFSKYNVNLTTVPRKYFLIVFFWKKYMKGQFYKHKFNSYISSIPFEIYVVNVSQTGKKIKVRFNFSATPRICVIWNLILCFIKHLKMNHLRNQLRYNKKSFFFFF